MSVESISPSAAEPKSKRLSTGERVFCFAVLLIVLGGYFGTNLAKNRLGRTLFGHDMQQYYATLRTMVFDQDFDYANEYFELGPHPEHLQVERVAKTGLYRNKYGVGWALVALIPYLVVHFMLWVGSLFGGGFAYTGYEAPYQIAATLAQVVAGGFGIIFIFLSLRRYFPRSHSMAAGLFILLGTPFLFYCIQDFHMVHAAGVFTVSLFLFLAISVAEDERNSGWRVYRRWAIWGVSAALMFVTRYTNVIFIVIAIYPLVHHLRRGNRRRLITGVAVAFLAGLPILALQFTMWRYLYGEWVVNSYGAQGEGFNWFRPEFINYLFSSNHGLIFTAPVVLVAFVGLFMGLWKKDAVVPRLLFGSLALACLLLLYVNASWHQWYFGWGFGSRSYLEASAGLAFGLAMFLSQLGKKNRRRAGYAYSVLGSVWTLWLMVLFAKGDLLSNGSTTFEQILTRSWRIFVGG
jgi:hypothetical protein